MSHPSTRQYSYSAQLGFLLAFFGMGLVLGSIACCIPLLGKINPADLKTKSVGVLLSNLLTNASAHEQMWLQFISVLFMFFLPVLFYAMICHKKPFRHLGFTHAVDIKEILVVVAIMIACIPAVNVLSEIIDKLPFSKATMQHFKDVEAQYDKQVAVFTQMKSFGDYFLSLMIMAFLPAVFEETCFRGGIQNLLSRWTKMPILAIVITSIIFSAVHGSYIGFLSRFALSFILGWMYYRTGNIWLNIIGHFTNNAIIVTSMYISSLQGDKTNIADADQYFPIWAGLLSLAAVYILFVLFEKVCKKDIDQPGKEVLIPGYNYYDPFDIGNEHSGNLN